MLVDFINLKRRFSLTFQHFLVMKLARIIYSMTIWRKDENTKRIIVFSDGAIAIKKIRLIFFLEDLLHLLQFATRFDKFR